MPDGQFNNSYRSDLNPVGMSSYGQYNGAQTDESTPTVGSSVGGGYTAPTGDWMSMLKSIMGGALNTTNDKGVTQQGWAAPVIGGASALLNGFLGMQQYGLAQDAAKEQKREFNLNYNNQRSLTNTQLEDRQRARVASSPTAYQSVSDYMKQNGV